MQKIIQLFLVVLVLFPFETKAASQDACAIWLCLLGGFPQGCEGAYSEFKHRLKKGRSPLPDLSSCTTGPNGEKSIGRYQMGYEPYYPCDEGFELQIKADEGGEKARCVSESYNQPCIYKDGLQIHQRDENQCYYYYSAERRAKPSYVKMWVDGQYLGKYYW